MVSVTSTLLIQLLAAGTIPLALIGLIASRSARGKSLRTKQFKMILILSLPPALVILAMQGILTGWMTVGGVAIVAIVAHLVQQRE